MAIFDKKDLEGMKEMAGLQTGMEKSAVKLLSTIKEIGELEKTQAYMAKQLIKLEEELVEGKDANGVLDKKGIAAKKIAITQTKKLIAEQKIYSESLQDAVKGANKLKSALSGTLDILKASSKQITKGFKAGFNLISKDNSITSMAKQINQSGLAMGLTSEKTKELSKNLSAAFDKSTAYGVSIGELAKMQASYSDEIGRTGMLTESSLSSMMLLSKLPGLGAEGAAGLAAEMDNFGISVAGTGEIISEIVQSSGEMGLNSGKVVKVMQKNMKLAQKYHFKGGINGLASMAQYATKMGIDMEAMAGMAREAFRPEGAVKMAAELQTMGGSFAKIADPFTLMFKARNDFEGFSKDIGKAAAELATFNSEEGMFEISGYQLDRLREISKITGVAEADLSQMALSSAKFNKIKSLIPPMHIDDKDRELISNIAKFDAKTGKYKVTIDGEEMGLNELNKTLVSVARGEKESLDKRVKASKTFDESFGDLITQLKSFLLPLVQELNTTLVPILQDVMGTLGENGEGLREYAREIGKDIGAAISSMASLLKDEDFINGIKDFVKGIGGFVKTIVKFVAGNGPLIAGLMAMTALAGPIMSLVGAISLFGSFTSGLKTLFGGGGPASKPAYGPQMKGKGGMSMGKGVGLGMLANVAGSGMNYARENMIDDRDSSMGKGMGVAAGALEWGGKGAMIGSMIAPGIGTAIGAGLGALGGGLYAAHNEGMFAKGTGNITTPGVGLVGEKGPELLNLAKGTSITPNNKLGGQTTKMEVTYKPIDISGTITLASSAGQSIDLDILKDPQFQREITKIIHTQTATMMNGGVASAKSMA